MAIRTLLPRVRDRRTLVGTELTEDRRQLLRFILGERGQLALTVHGLERPIQVKVADNNDEWTQAFRLLTLNYQGRGYDAGGNDYRFTSFHALPCTTVFVAKEGNTVCATMSLVADNVLLGLPMESLYRAEIQKLRQQGCRLGEVGSLAFAQLGLRSFTLVFEALCRLMFQYHAAQGGDTWVITINPRHRAYYARTFGFNPLGPRRSYANVQGHPAEAYLVDRALMAARSPRMYRGVFGTALPAAALEQSLMPTGLVRALAARSTQTSLPFTDEILRYVRETGSPRRWPVAVEKKS
ncbi:MAG: hypothetical protein AB7K24_09925 [Gemmataceae bacterium]